MTRRTRPLPEQLVQTAGLEVAVVLGMGALIGAFNAVHLDGDCTRILPHLHLGRNAFAQKRRPDQTRQEAARSITTDQGHLAQPLLDAFDSVLCRQGNGCGYGFTEYLREKGLASLQGLDSLSLFGSPTWARTRDLRINRLPLDLPANPHECSLSGVRASNKSRPFHLRKAREGVI